MTSVNANLVSSAWFISSADFTGSDGSSVCFTGSDGRSAGFNGADGRYAGFTGFQIVHVAPNMNVCQAIGHRD